MSEISKTQLTYDEQRKLEIQQAEQRFQRVSGLLHNLNLKDWRYIAADAENPRQLGRLVCLDIQGELSFSFDWKDKTRLNIGVQFPRDRQNNSYSGYGVKHASITVSTAKTAEQIARDIERRLLPAYLPELEKVRASIASHERYLNGKTALGDALKAAFPALRMHDGIRGNGYSNQTDMRLTGDGVDIQCNPNSVTIELGDLTLEQAQHVLQFVFTLKNNDKGEMEQ